MTRFPVPVFLAALLAAPSATAEDWRLRGEVHSRVDHYRVHGEDRLSPYAHTGTQAYQELQLQLSGQTSPERVWEVNTTGVLSGSDYRTPEQGFSPEWIHLRHENAAGALPWRVDLGDQRAHFSRYTLDRTLRGARLELQSTPGSAWQNSLVSLTGRAEREWEGVSGAPVVPGAGDRFHGGSWLLQHDRYGRYAVNVVQSDPGDRRGVAADRHRVGSLAGEWDAAAYRQAFTAEAEWAWLAGGANPDAGHGEQGLGLHLNGRDAQLPLSYDFHYERFDVGFEPAGVPRVATARLADSRRMGAGGNWRFGTGAVVQGRYDRYVDDVSTQVLAVDDWSLRLDSPTSFGLLPRLGSEWGVRFRDRENRPGTIETSATEATWGVRLAGRDPESSTRLRLRWYALDDEAQDRITRRERQLSLSHTRSLMLGPVSLQATPGMDFRHQTGFAGVTLVNPTLRLGASHAGHRLGLDLGYRDFDRPAGVDLQEYSLRLDYHFRMQTHVFGLAYDHLLREQGQGDDMTAWRAGAFWRYSFDHAFGGRNPDDFQGS